jgi:hypothetical protein
VLRREDGTFGSVRDRVMVTMTEWEEELHGLRADLGPTVEMRMRWRLKREDLLGRARWGVWSLFVEPPEDRLLFTLYDAGAASGDLAVVEIEAQPHDESVSAPQGSFVHVAGTPSPGHAAVILINGVEFWPVYPGTLTLRAPKFSFNGEDTLRPPRRPARLRTRRARIIGVIAIVLFFLAGLVLRSYDFEGSTTSDNPSSSAPLTGSR